MRPLSRPGDWAGEAPTPPVRTAPTWAESPTGEAPCPRPFLSAEAGPHIPPRPQTWAPHISSELPGTAPSPFSSQFTAPPPGLPRGLLSHTDGPHQQPRHLRAAHLSTHPKTALLWGHSALSFQANAHGNFQSFGQWATAKPHPLAFCRPNFRAKCLNPVTSIHCHLVFIEHLLRARRCCEGSGFTTVARSPAPWSSHPRAGTRASLVWPDGNVCVLPPPRAALRASGHPQCSRPTCPFFECQGEGVPDTSLEAFLEHSLTQARARSGPDPVGPMPVLGPHHLPLWQGQSNPVRGGRGCPACCLSASLSPSQ